MNYFVNSTYVQHDVYNSLYLFLLLLRRFEKIVEATLFDEQTKYGKFVYPNSTNVIGTFFRKNRLFDSDKLIRTEDLTENKKNYWNKTTFGLYLLLVLLAINDIISSEAVQFYQYYYGHGPILSSEICTITISERKKQQ